MNHHARLNSWIKKHPDTLLMRDIQYILNENTRMQTENAILKQEKEYWAKMAMEANNGEQ